jgi:hypothetical protein
MCIQKYTSISYVVNVWFYLFNVSFICIYNDLGMSNRLKPYNRLLGQVSDRVPGYSVENLFCSV